MESVLPLLSDPAAWVALVTLIVMEVVLGIDNLIFISILTNKLAFSLFSPPRCPAPPLPAGNGPESPPLTPHIQKTE